MKLTGPPLAQMHHAVDAGDTIYSWHVDQPPGWCALAGCDLDVGTLIGMDPEDGRAWPVAVDSAAP